MTYDPVHLSQRLLWRAGHLRGHDSADTTRLDGMDEAGRERFFRKGSEQVATLAARIEAQTGCTLESRTALDFGCGVGRNALALAERCDYVYGLDVSPAVLREADRNAGLRKLSNVEWMQAGRLDELSGRYDLVVSFFVFQHIPSREGERIIDTLVRGLRPGGVGAIHVTLPPPFRALDRSYLYRRMNSYSLSRLGQLLADASVTEWHAKLHSRPVAGTDERSYEEATVIFRKD
ncbi:MAG TPA: class I SAM-dependent methyltransferase [Solirubrobacteraceae bacterium]|nr:class I SAM-dependent methyltransferase [Solirubrobacteraceae bacterium]